MNALGHKTAIGAFNFEDEPPKNVEKVQLNKFELLKSGVKSLNYDIIHPHQAQVLYYLLAKKPDKPIVFHYHAASNIVQELNLKFSMSLFKNKISKFISVSKKASNHLKEWIGECDDVVIYNGVDTKIFNTEISTPYKKGSPQLLFVSGLRKYKKTKILIESMPKVLKEFPDAHLQIVGDGEDLTTLQDMISRKKLNHKIDLIGKINHDELKFYYSSCDLYISASTFEVCPIPTIEAMACGKPLVLFDIEPHAEIIRTSNAGKLFSSPDDIVLAIDDVFHNREYFGNLATKFGQELDWSIIAKQVSGIYDSL